MASFFWQSCLTVCLIALWVSLVSSDLICEDKTKSCKKWVNDKKLCDENPKYKKQRFYVSMSRLCKKSCLMCGDDDASLFDTDSRCFSYFKKGYCDMKPHQGFMLRRCKYSCRSTIRSGIMSPGRGNFQRNDPPAQQMQQRPAYLNQQQADNLQQYGQQNPQEYTQQYGQQYPQNYGQQQYPSAYGQQNDAQPQQTTGQQQLQAQPETAGLQQPQTQPETAGQQLPQAQPQASQSLSDLPVQVQALSSRKHKLEKGSKHDDDMFDDDAVNDTDDDMD